MTLQTCFILGIVLNVLGTLLSALWADHPWQTCLENIVRVTIAIGSVGLLVWRFGA